MHKTATAKESYQKLYRIIIVLAVLLLISMGLLLVNSVLHGRFSAAVGSAKITENVLGNPPEGAEAAAQGLPVSSADMKRAGDQNASAKNSVKPVFLNAVPFFAGPVFLDAAGGADSQAADSQSYIELYKRHSSDNEIFEVHNMLPGDCYTKYFGVKALHSDDISIRFEAQVSRNTKNFWNVMKIRVTQADTQEIIFDGSLKDLDDTVLERPFSKNAAMQTEVRYKIDFYMDTTVGNEYQGASLKVKLVWSTKDRGDLEPSPGGGFFEKIISFFAAIGAFLRRMLYAITGLRGG
ncbi:MAG: hypothetical protein LBS36_01695 [Oscillospiraceae bacterium]|nr:hypothetical protein [Oscillospiraceae bacterium]